MSKMHIEEDYPISFRSENARILGEHMKVRHSVELIGMKRVGISNFLRFFLHHKDIAKTYIDEKHTYLFIPVDLHDLIEVDIYQFWLLTFKRIMDTIHDASTNKESITEAERIFNRSVKNENVFWIIDGIRQVIEILVNNDIMPTIFFIRFDRMSTTFTKESFGNLQGLKDASGQKLTFVFTSYRGLHHLNEEVFSLKSLAVFTHKAFIKPAEKKDIEIIFQTYAKRYKENIDPAIKQKIIQLSGGHVQYLQLALIILFEKKNKLTRVNLEEYLQKDERIILQSEEIWDSLTVEEQDILKKVRKSDPLNENDFNEGRYLWRTGLLTGTENVQVFNTFFQHYLTHASTDAKKSIEFTKKEHLLFTYLEKNLNEVCERDMIIERVWPEYKDVSVSDWTIDRLVSRLRSKLINQDSDYAVQTVKTRGFKLIKNV